MSIKNWIAAFRPKTLPAAAAPIVVGAAIAFSDGVQHWLSVSLALISALLIQIGTNLFNDYADFKKGADTESRKGPVRVTQAGLIKAESVRNAAVIAFALSAVAGTYLMFRGGLPIILIGVLSILFGFLYTAGKYSLAYTGLADLFVLIFFGPVAVAGTYYVQALEWSQASIIAGLAPGALATAILLVNNIRDVDEDRAAGKKTLVVRAGRPFAYALYSAMLTIATAVPLILLVTEPGHRFAWIASVVAVSGVYLLAKIRSAESGAQYNELLASTARLLLIYSVVFGIVWIL